MPSRYTVVQGDHITRIAERWGFRDGRTVWDHPANAGLRAARTSPNVLYPGDELTIPDRTVNFVAAATGKTHSFVLKHPRLRLSLRLLNFRGEPLGGEDVAVKLGMEADLATDGDGRLDVDITTDTAGGTLGLARGGLELFIGYLDPIDQETGVRARLANLGYLMGAVEDLEDLDERQLAIEELQVDHGLSVTGKLDDATRAKLLEVHGC